jgi:2'-5' RNA ligase
LAIVNLQSKIDNSNMRAFIAIDLPESIQAALGRQQAAFRAACPDARWTRPEGIHLTLKFLGEISDDQVRQVTEALASLAPPEKFSIEVKGFGFFPDPRRPRVFWVGLEAPPALGELARRVEDCMERLGFAREDHPFTPHLTLARFKVPRPQPAFQALLERHKETTLGGFEVSEFFLFESKLSPHGAEYRKVARIAQSA